MKFITTSWDDGHPCDIRLAALLDKYSLQGTFYIPRNNTEHEVMNENEIKKLSHNFEIGGHTLTHKNLLHASEKELLYEVKGSYKWLQDILDEKPVSFCPPFGVYNKNTLAVIQQSGFKYIRSTELLSPFLCTPVAGTTLQAFEHSRLTYFGHLLKRGNIRSMMLWAGSGFSDDIFRLLDYYLDYIETHGGCLHLWGHSWEIDEYKLWDKTEKIFKHISSRNGFSYIKNKELINN